MSDPILTAFILGMLPILATIGIVGMNRKGENDE